MENYIKACIPSTVEFLCTINAKCIDTACLDFKQNLNKGVW